jgi:hypothetical protein
MNTPDRGRTRAWRAWRQSLNHNPAFRTRNLSIACSEPCKKLCWQTTVALLLLTIPCGRCEMLSPWDRRPSQPAADDREQRVRRHKRAIACDYCRLKKVRCKTASSCYPENHELICPLSQAIAQIAKPVPTVANEVRLVQFPNIVGHEGAASTATLPPRRDWRGSRPVFSKLLLERVPPQCHPPCPLPTRWQI